MKNYCLLALISFFLFFISCNNNSNTRICTDIFKMVSIKIEGIQLDTFYTIRLSNNDTIWEQNYDTETYLVLTDSYQNKLVNSQDSFHFIGIKNDSVVVVEPYVFAADDCHINKITGKD